VTIYNFMSFCVQKFPAKHYMVVLSGHGGGTEPDFLMKTKAHSVPSRSGVETSLRGYTGRPKRSEDRYSRFDSCLMSMAEVCYELKGLVDIAVGSEGYSPASGWPYCEMLERLAREADDAASMSANGG